MRGLQRAGAFLCVMRAHLPLHIASPPTRPAHRPFITAHWCVDTTNTNPCTHDRTPVYNTGALLYYSLSLHADIHLYTFLAPVSTFDNGVFAVRSAAAGGGPPAAPRAARRACRALFIIMRQRRRDAPSGHLEHKRHTLAVLGPLFYSGGPTAVAIRTSPVLQATP